MFINACLRTCGLTPEIVDVGDEESILSVGTTTEFGPGSFRRYAHLFDVTSEDQLGLPYSFIGTFCEVASRTVILTFSLVRLAIFTSMWFHIIQCPPLSNSTKCNILQNPQLIASISVPVYPSFSPPPPSPNNSLALPSNASIINPATFGAAA